MTKGIEALSSMEYPGRVIIIGRGPEGDDTVMYAITGRSPSSQARRLVVSNDRRYITVTPTDEKLLATGNPDLLIYHSVIIDQGIAVSNGKQTADIPPQFRAGARPVSMLQNALKAWEYEPDDPNFTPRISGCVFDGAALSIIRRSANGSVERKYFDVPGVPGKGKLIATYTGENITPLPSFSGEPLDVDIPYGTAEEAVRALYETLRPAEGKADYRVAAAAVYRARNGKIAVAIKNRQ